MKYFQLIIFTFLVLNSGNAQELKKQKWNKRVILVISNDESSSTVDTQLALLNEPNELQERKLIIYRVLPKKYKILDNRESQWTISSELYDKYSSKKTNFKIILIGLDGGVKLKSEEIIEPKILFSMIDQMPMRREELDKNN